MPVSHPHAVRKRPNPQPPQPPAFLSPAEYLRFGTAPPAPQPWSPGKRVAAGRVDGQGSSIGEQKPSSGAAQPGPQTGNLPESNGDAALSSVPQRVASESGNLRPPAPACAAGFSRAPGAASLASAPQHNSAAPQRRSAPPCDDTSPRRIPNFNLTRHMVRVGSSQNRTASRWSEGLRGSPRGPCQAQNWTGALRRDVGWRPLDELHAERVAQMVSENRQSGPPPPPVRSSSAGADSAPKAGGNLRSRLEQTKERLQCSIAASR
eukprot:Hpha_TRINITY_DN19571_c0_g1::TRINITY_DN19571_c0_g1_i1::g.33541::m.33541